MNAVGAFAGSGDLLERLAVDNKGMSLSRRDVCLRGAKEGKGVQILSEIERLRSPEGYLYAGYPHFLELFGRDSLIASLALMRHDPEIAAVTLKELARLQGSALNHKTGEEPGKIIHEFFPSNAEGIGSMREKRRQISWLEPDVPFYFSADSTPLWLIGLHEYVRSTRNLELALGVWDNAMRCVDWICNKIERYGFVAYGKPGEGKGLMSQSWKDGIGSLLDDAKGPVCVVEVQGYAYAALQGTSELALLLGRNDQVKRLKDAARRLEKDFQEAFWMENSRYYALAIDGEGRRLDVVTSNPGQLLFTGILDAHEDRCKAVVRRLAGEDMITEYGIRTHSAHDSYFDPFEYQRGSVWPHDNFMIAIGLRRMGGEYARFSKSIGSSVLRALGELGSLLEYYGVDAEGRLIFPDKMKVKACAPQAWTAAAALYFRSRQ